MFTWTSCKSSRGERFALRYGAAEDSRAYVEAALRQLPGFCRRFLRKPSRPLTLKPEHDKIPVYFNLATAPGTARNHVDAQC